MKAINTVLVLLLLTTIGEAQSINDALRYAIYDGMGTARSMSIGNAISPLGGDFFTISHNPAGLATYRKSEFTFTPSFRTTSVDASLAQSGTFNEVDNDLLMSNLGMVIAKTSEAGKWKSVNFGIGYNRHTSFDRQMYYRGSTEGSITDRWVERAEGKGLNDLLDYESGLAFDVGAIFDGNEDLSYDSDYDLDGRGDLPKRETLQSRGGSGEIVMGLGANLNHKLYMGLSVGIPLVRYRESRTYEEDQPRVDENTFFSSLSYKENLEQSGAGVNAKMGIIYRISQAVRWSFHYHTPTVLTILDEFDNGLAYEYYDVDRVLQSSEITYPPDGNTLNFEYDVITPYELGTGVSVIIGNQGFVSAEVAYKDYSAARFDFNSDLSSSEDLEYERELNQAIDETFGGAWKIRLGGEWAKDVFRLRAGTIINQRPYTNDDGFDMTYSLGAGLRFNKFFMDLGYRLATSSSTYLPYQTSNQDLHPQQEVSVDDRLSDVFLTFGIKF